jgi:hypothetical protein
MPPPLHITSGDCAGNVLEKSGVSGNVFVWHDILYDGPRIPGWPDEQTLEARAQFIETQTGGGLSQSLVLETLRHQYAKLAEAAAVQDRIVLWFDACLFDQSMLAHLLACLAERQANHVELICIDSFPGIKPFHGLGQLAPEQLASLLEFRKPVTKPQSMFATEVDRTFAIHDRTRMTALAQMRDAPLPWLPAAATRWLQEQPDPTTGLGRLETLALAAIRNGNHTPQNIFNAVAAADIPPQYWGDTTLWAKINGLAARNPPLVRIEGPTPKLPQWGEVGTYLVFHK